MRKVKSVIPLFFAVLLLSGCGETEEPPQEVPVTYLHEQANDTIWNDLVIDAITPCCAFDSTTDKLIIYPYFDSDLSVTVELILTSENNFWEAITSGLDKGNVSTSEKYSFATMSTGTTVGLVPIDEETAYWVTSSDLPSGYVQAVLKNLCK